MPTTVLPFNATPVAYDADVVNYNYTCKWTMPHFNGTLNAGGNITESLWKLDDSDDILTVDPAWQHIEGGINGALTSLYGTLSPLIISYLMNSKYSIRILASYESG